ncbi:hypothetical protein [Candidatus Electronema sp. PJ]|uniref:hypothetical protein n=1 Tax=Candidatus Electronema sp. PJ TaxID=3401572 RepID=UPI003AA7D09B
MPEHNTTETENQDKPAAVQPAAPRRNSAKPKKEKSWLDKNIHSLLASGILLLTFFLYWKIIMYPADLGKNGMKEILIYIVGALTTVSTQIVSYYFGSSSGSASKSEELHDLRDKTHAVNAPSNPTSVPNNPPSEPSNSPIVQP